MQTNAVKSLYLQMDKNTATLLLSGNGDMPEEAESHQLPCSIFDYQNPTKNQPKRDLLIAVGCITSSMERLFSRQSAAASV